MGSFLLSPLTAAIAVVIAAIAIFLSRRNDYREPPFVRANIPIPFLGHFIGLLRHWHSYYATLTDKQVAGDPIVTIDVLFNKIYVVKHAKMVAVVQRNHKILDFEPFLLSFAESGAGIKGKGLDLLRSGHGGGNVSKNIMRAMAPGLLGDELPKLNLVMLREMLPMVDAFVTRAGRCDDLHEWGRAVITKASTEAIWGKFNPFRDQKLVDDFWYFETHLAKLSMLPFPRLTASDVYTARENVVAALAKFAEVGGYEDESCSFLARARYETQRQAGCSLSDIARLEGLLNIGVLTNAVPGVFWTLWHIYSRTELLDAVREEVMTQAVSTVDGVTLLDVSMVKERCPILLSAIQEVLRLTSHGSSVRCVSEDLIVDGRYLLKKGAWVQQPMYGINVDRAAWGDDAEVFDHTRFLPEQANGKSRRAKPRPTAYLSWGSSPHLCPGRHFATAEIVGVVAMLICRVALEPEGGIWYHPGLKEWSMSASVVPPAKAFPVTVVQRPDDQDRKWNLVVSGNKPKFDLITG